MCQAPCTFLGVYLCHDVYPSGDRLSMHAFLSYGMVRKSEMSDQWASG